MILDSEKISRRNFLKKSFTVGGGLVIGFHIPFAGKFMEAFAENANAPAVPNFEVPNAFIQIAPDNTITLIINKLEMGQGVNTSMAQLIAEELECDWKQIKSVSAPVAPVYNHTFFKVAQITGGSTALASSWEQYRRVGAMAREMLIGAAAETWGVSPQTCFAKAGYVYSKAGKKLSFGELAEKANARAIPQDIKLKPAKNFKVIGKSMSRVDSHDKSTGAAVYGIDVKIPGMLYVMVARPPVFGAELRSVDDSAAKKISGVEDIVRFGNSVAVLAKNTWAARRGRDALHVDWDFKGKDQFSSDTLFASYKKTAELSGVKARKTGDPVKMMDSAKQVVEAEYEFPYLAHAAMEPMNCTIHYDGEKCEIWSGHQMPTNDRATAAQVLELDPLKVKVNTVYAGGSFGRRANKNSDYVLEAALLAKQVKKPLKIIWSREDDMKGGYYRPMYYHRVKAGVDARKFPIAWEHTLVGQSVVGGSMFEQMMVKNGVDPTVTEGISDSKYEIANFSLDLHMPKLEIPTLWWRSVGHTHTAYVMETMIDELAHLTKQDPLYFRRKLLAGSARHLAVLDLMSTAAEWGRQVPKGQARGLAIHESFNSIVGHVVDLSIHEGSLKIHKITSAVHCGTVVNPDSAKMQVESAVAFALSAFLQGQITFLNGKVVQSNFHDYPVLRMADMPKMEVHFVKTQDPPTGLGEPGVPPLAPAVANAIFQLTKKRIRKLPLGNQLT